MKIIRILYNILAIVIVLCFAFSVGILASKTEIYAVASPSMEPELSEGDMVFVRASDEYLVGDVVTARLPSGDNFTHRICYVDSENGLVYTQGDNNPSVDSLPTSVDDIIGKVVFSVPLLGFLSLKFSPVKVCFVLAGVMLVLMLIRYLLFRFKKPKEDEAI